ncbi:MAG: 2-oxoacid:acceptor oxidoreductase family protein [Candidatus Competibacteraceae bacterium]
MYRIRFHGRGGQGIKTAGRILGTAFFLEGFEVQDAPLYGAERRGAPLFAYVRAAHKPINERGIIRNPDLVVVADDTLLAVPAAGVLLGITPQTVLLLDSGEPAPVWQQRLNFPGRLLVLAATTDVEDRAALPYSGAVCAGAAVRLIGLRRDSLKQAIEGELADADPAVLQRDLDQALTAYDRMAEHTGIVGQGEIPSASAYAKPAWVTLPLDDVGLAAPDIHGAATSVQVRTGLWRTLRPVIDHHYCRQCLTCATFCPDGAIQIVEGQPQIDYAHCKGCLICVVQCPYHAMTALPEHRIAGEVAA